ncbi:MAG TPA: orotate phosphoribosyltransferase [Vicinamibacterales bacterium]|nr:orotate phosphoribosyltransferase [Vicinamibacterales bacterium]
MSEPTALERLLLARSVQRGDFVLASGQRSSFYIDCRLSTMSAEGMVLVGKAGLAAIRSMRWEPNAVGGLTMGADPVAYAIAAASFGSSSPIDAFSVRKDAKQHGTRRRIEGNFRSGDRVVVVEDVITSGGSALQAIEAVTEAGGEIVGVLAVVDREQGGRGRIEASGHPVVSLTTSTRLGLPSGD